MTEQEKMMQMIAQYRSGGGDSLSDFENYISAMGAGGRTPLGLNQWQRSDKPVMEDFNEDNRIIDAELRALREELANKATNEDNRKIDDAVRELWAKKVNQGELNEYDLSVVNGLESYAKFSINENKQVFIYGAISSHTVIPYGEVAAVLPEGFRSKTRWEFPATGFKTNQRSGYAGTVVVTPDGNMEARILDEINLLYFNFSYPAQ